MTIRIALIALCLCGSTRAVWGQTERLGPRPAAGGPRPLVVEVQATEPVDEPGEPAATAVENEAASLDARQQLAKAEMEAAQRQLDRLSVFNRYAQPAAAVFYSSKVLPYTQVRPVLIPDPVEVVVPSSPFSNVLLRAQRNRQQAQLEMEADSPPGLEKLRTLEQVESDLRLSRFMQQSAQARMQQLRAVSYLSYSQLWLNLGDKLELELMEAELREQQLLQERQNLLEGSQPARN